MDELVGESSKGQNWSTFWFFLQCCRPQPASCVDKSRMALSFEYCGFILAIKN